MPGVADLLAPWRSTALLGTTPHHVTLLFPWVDPPIDDSSTQTLVDVVGTWEPFDAELVGVRALNSGVVVLTPEPAERFLDLTAQLSRAFHGLEPYGGRYPAIPHLTIARAGDEVEATAVRRDIEAAIGPHLPISFCVDHLGVNICDESSWWTVHTRLQFGAPAD